MATEGRLATATGFESEQVAAHLSVLESRGFLQRLPGRPEGVAITSAGRTAHAALLQSLSYAANEAEGLYDRFLALNGEFKAVCTSWQIHDDGSPNDHSDPSYDQAVLARLWVIHDAVAPILTELTALMAHFERYLERLDAAARRVHAGDQTALLRPLSDSYHDIWMELHQDLRMALGRTA